MDDFIDITPSFIEIYEEIMAITVSTILQSLKYSEKEKLAYENGINSLINTLKKTLYNNEELLAYDDGINKAMEILTDLNSSSN